MRVISFIFLFLLLLGCDVSGLSPSKAINVVQNSESVFNGVSTDACIRGVIQTASATERKISIIGWISSRNMDRNLDVFYDLKDNGQLLRYHWMVDDKNMTVTPVNKLAQDVMVSQKIK